MNKIYSLKYSHITGGLVAVSELTRKVSVGTSRKKVILGIILSSIYGSYGETAFAAMLDINNIWTRDYLDLAQNRGEFRPGATNVQLMMKDGKIFHFPELPVPDFSAVSNKGATTSIGGAYSVTATHNGTQHHAITTQSWDQTAYKASNRVSSGDFSVHRLNKFVVETTGVTESADFSLSPEDAMKRYGVNYNGKEQIIGFRAGAGTTSTILNGKQYLFGQNYNPDLLSASLFNLDWKNKSYIYTNRTPFKNSPIFGDSGSGSYLYDKEQQKWVFHGVTSTVGFISSTNIAWTNYALFNNDRVNNLKNNFTNTMQLDGKKQELSSIIKDKDLSVSGGGELTLKQDTDLGIGGLIFDKNQTYKVSGKDKSYKGAGIDIDNNTTVEWNVKGVAGDNLHKIGSGTLDVKTAQGNNLKTGNGTVILSAEKAFNKIYMAGGKGTVKINAKDALSESGNGETYFTRNGGTLDLNGYDQSFQKIAATDAGTTVTNSNVKQSTLSLTNTDAYMYHGNVSGNISINHIINTTQKHNNNTNLIFDGSVDIKNDISVRNAQLTLQGHATEHAIFKEGSNNCLIPLLCQKDYSAAIRDQESTVNKRYNTEYKSNNQVASFSQPDWESRKFNFRKLNLENATLSIGRDANVKGHIEAKNSQIVLGNKTAYIDMFSGRNITGEGFGFRQQVHSGDSAGESSFNGSLSAQNSKITVGDKSTVTMTGALSLINTDLIINKGATVTAQGKMYVDKAIELAGTLTLTGTPTENNKYSPAIYMSDGYNMTEDGATLKAQNYAWVNGNIKSDKKASILFGVDQDKEDNLDKTTHIPLATGLLGGFDTSYTGGIDAPAASASMYNTLWRVNGQSALQSLKTRDSLLLFSNIENSGFHTVTVNTLDATNTAVIMRADLSQSVNQSDKLIVKNQLTGSNNSLSVDIQKVGNNNSGLNVDLITAPKGSNKEIFKASTQAIGFSNMSPVISTKEDQEHTTWTLTGYKVAENTASSGAAKSYMSGNYKAFLTEVNNLNKRMGDLRDTNGEAGAWARIMSGAGSASGGYSDNYTHVQIGVDKKHELDGLDLFTGLTMTYTDSHASSNAFSGKTKSVGAGLYASAIFDSGAYIDLIGKYVHHDNEYSATFAGLGTKDYSSHSLYAGAEAGYRYHVTEDAWIEPQAELVYGAVSGKRFDWQDRGMSVTMKDKDFNPVIGRTGVDVGKSFSGKDWKVTARAGVGYQFDLLNNGETVLRDASGEKRIKGEKDGRMLMNVGLNAEIRDNLRFGLEFEKSAFGKYNVDNAVNASFRYSF